MNVSDRILQASGRILIPGRRRLLLERLLRDHPAIEDVIAQNHRDADSLSVACVRRICESSRKTIALVYHPHIWSQVGEDFAQQLRNKGFNCLPVSLDPGTDDHAAFYPLDRSLVEQLTWVDLFIGSSMPLWLKWGSGVLGNTKTLDIDRAARCFASDHNPFLLFYLLTHGSHIIRPMDNELVKNVATARLQLPEFMKIPADAVGPRRKTYILPLTPSKYERIQTIRAGLSSCDIDRILVCATRSDLAGYWVPTYGQELIFRLLDRFPRNKVVFRPRPEDRDRPEVRAIIQRFSGQGRFIFDNHDDYAPQYARGVLLITDRSSTGQTFCLAAHRPAIFFQPERLNVHHITVPALMDVGCFLADSLEQVVSLATQFIEKPFQNESRIAEIERKTYAGNHSFADKFMNYLDHILRDQVHPDWVVISMPDACIVGTTTDAYEQAILSFAR